MKSFFRNLQIKLHVDTFITRLKLQTSLLRRLIPPPSYYCSGTKRTYYSANSVWSLDLSDHVQREIAVNSLAFARELTLRLCSSGEDIIDVGANRGNYCIPMAKKLKGESKVYAFEPNPKSMSDLQHHIRLNNLSPEKLITLKFGLGRHFYEVTIKEPAFNSGATTAVVDIPDSKTAAKFPIQIKTLDSFFEEHKVGFIKIDVEGMDADVLLGGLSTIDNSKPSIYIEVSKETITDIFRLLERLGYELYIVNDDSKKLSRRIDKNIVWGNLLAIMPQKTHLVDDFISN